MDGVIPLTQPDVPLDKKSHLSIKVFVFRLYRIAALLRVDRQNDFLLPNRFKSVRGFRLTAGRRA